MENFENKLMTAILSFAMDLNSLMENSNDELSDEFATAYEQNSDMTIEDFKQIILRHVIRKLSEYVEDGE